MTKILKIIVLFGILIFSRVSLAQVSEEINNGISSTLASKYGDVDFINIIDVNTEKGKYQQLNLQITDPYQTLKNCYVFTANIGRGGVVGVYKNNVLVWDSGLIVDLYGANLNSKIFGITDLNNDNNVEIIASWNYGVSSFIQNLWIFRWNSIDGTILNEREESRRREGLFKSLIYSFNYNTEILDVDGDGIMEIKGVEKGSSNKSKIYSWNGQKYGDYGVTMPEFIPMNLLSAEVSCKVSKSQFGLLYNYGVKNDTTSKQKVAHFVVDRPSENTFINSGPPNKKWIYRGGLNKTKWDVSIDLNEYPFDYILPGDERQGFKLEIETPLIFIGNFYIQGKNGKKNTDIKNLFDNSFKGKTLCGRYPDDQFVIQKFIDSLLSYNNQSLDLGWIKNESTYNKYSDFLQNAKTYLEIGDSSLAKSELQLVLENCVLDSSSSLTSEAFALLYFNTEYLISQLPEDEAYPYLKVNFKDSQGNFIQDGSLKYYDAGWKEAVNNGDGSFNVETEKNKVSLRMHYAGASQTVSDISAQNNKYTFTTVNTTVQLKDSQESLLDGGTVQYYASGWKEFGDAVNGEATKELLPKEYSFRMKYGGASLDKKQDIGENATVVFQTVNAKVQLQDSQGNLLDGGTVQYYASGWKEFGNAENGEATKELLPKEYSFRMKYGGASLDKKQDIGENATVVFQTVNAKVQLQDSQGNLLDGGTVQYYASGWKEFGDAENGEATKELLPKEYSFRMKYGGASLDKKQNIGENPTVVFQTVNAKVQLQDSQGNLLDGGTVQYYASGWKEFGDAENGEAAKELLPKEYSFRMKYGGASLDKKQDIGENLIVVFQTINAIVQLQDSQGNLLDGGTVQYYASGWKEFGDAENGEATKELLPKEYSFRMKFGGASLDKKQDIGENGTVVFQTVNAKVQLQDSQGNLLDGDTVQYYASGWKEMGDAVNGEATKELLPKEYSFRMKYGGTSIDEKNDISNNQTLIFSTVEAIIKVTDENGQQINDALTSYYASGWKQIGNTVNGEISKELLPKNYSFRVNNSGANQDKQQDISTNNIVEFIIE